MYFQSSLELESESSVNNISNPPITLDFETTSDDSSLSINTLFASPAIQIPMNEEAPMSTRHRLNGYSLALIEVHEIKFRMENLSIFQTRKFRCEYQAPKAKSGFMNWIDFQVKSIFLIKEKFVEITIEVINCRNKTKIGYTFVKLFDQTNPDGFEQPGSIGYDYQAVTIQELGIGSTPTPILGLNFNWMADGSYELAIATHKCKHF